MPRFKWRCNCRGVIGPKWACVHFSVPDRTTSGDVVGAHMGAYGVATWGALYAAGVVSYSRLDNWMRLKVLAEDKTIQGFNVGITSLRKTSDGLPSSLPDHHHCAA
jgi:Autotransporter beta-domain